MSQGRRLRITLPGLADAARRCAAQGASPRLPQAEWLLARGRRRPSTVPAWREWLLAGADLGPDVLERFPAGPCTHAARTGQRPTVRLARAEPVHLLTALDHLQLAAPVPVPLDATESDAVLATLNGHLEGSGFVLHADGGQGWLCECPPDLQFTAVDPSSAVGLNLRGLLPDGRDAGRVRALVNELQMLLHEHPVNERRAASGQPLVNSVWLWGAGSAGEIHGAARGVLVTDDEWLSGLWRLHGGRLRPARDLAASLADEEGSVLVAIAPTVTGGGAAEELQRIDQTVFAPVCAALAAARIQHIALHLGGAELDIPAAARWEFWRRARPLAEVLQ
jgi:hypothetical protein